MYELFSRACVRSCVCVCVCVCACVRARARACVHTHTNTRIHTHKHRARMHAHTHTYLYTCVGAGKFLNSEEQEAQMKDQEAGLNWQTRNVRRLVLLEALHVHTYLYENELCIFRHSQNMCIYVSREGEKIFIERGRENFHTKCTVNSVNIHIFTGWCCSRPWCRSQRAHSQRLGLWSSAGS